MRPTALSLWCIGAGLLLALLAPDLPIWRILIGSWLAITLIDAVLAYTLSQVRVTRAVSPNLAVNRSSLVRIDIHNPQARSLRIYCNDELPQNTQQISSLQPIVIAGKRSTQVQYKLRATRRGDGQFGHVSMLIESPFRLWEFRRRKRAESTVRVYPDFAAINQYLELISDQQTQRLGLNVRPRHGEGLEFHQLREYHPNDGIRSIDWKATARRRRLITRQYTVERDQRVLFMLDSGSRMRAKDGQLSHFDHALNAMLLLSHVALRQGDTVAVKTFGPSKVWLPDLKGVQSINRLLNAVYAIHTGPAAADFVGAAEEIMQQQRKRSLIVILTNLREEDSDLMPALQLLRRRHVVVLASLRESAVDAAVVGDAQQFDNALRVAGSSRYLLQRQQAQTRYAYDAHILIDCVPNQLPTKLVNSYWRLKRAGTL